MNELFCCLVCWNVLVYYFSLSLLGFSLLASEQFYPTGDFPIGKESEVPTRFKLAYRKRHASPPFY